MLDDNTSEPNDLQLHSIAHGVISLDQVVHDYGGLRRRVRVSKMRGVKFREGYHDFTLNTGGTSGTTMLPIRAGQRLTLQDTQEVCPGTYEGVISYQPNGGPGQDTLSWGSPISDGSVLVGRFRYVIRRP